METSPPDAPETQPAASPALRGLFAAIGFVFVGLGAVGVVVPGLPTTPFMLLAAWMFSKSSPRFHRWLWDHRVFGPYVRAWARHRVIPRHAKLLSSGVMALGLGLMLGRAAPPVVWVPTALVCLAGTLFIWRCPSAPPSDAAA